MSRMPNSPIRIATAAYPPFVNECGIYTLKPTKECPYPGLDHEILNFLFEHAKIPYKLFPQIGKVDWGERQADGTMSGLVGDVINGKYDTVSSLYVINENRTDQIQFSYNVYYQTGYYMVSNAIDPYKEWVNSATIIYRVFDIFSTLGLFGILFVLTIMVLVFNKLLESVRSQNSNEKRTNTTTKPEIQLRDWTMRIRRSRSSRWCGDSIHSFDEAMTLIFQGKQQGPFMSTKILFLIIAFTVLLMFNLFQGGLFTIMVTPLNLNARQSENAIIQKLEKKEFRLIDTQYEYENAQLFDNIRHREEPFYVRFRKILMNNPVIIENDPHKLREKFVNNYGYVKFSGSHLTAYSTGIGRCDVTWVPASYDRTAWFAYIFRNGSQWRPIFFSNIIMIQSIVPNLYSRYLNGSDSCLGTNHEHQPVKSLQMVTLFGVFLLPIFGAVGGLCIVCIEIAKYRRKAQYIKNKNSFTADQFEC